MLIKAKYLLEWISFELTYYLANLFPANLSYKLAQIVGGLLYLGCWRRRLLIAQKFAHKKKQINFITRRIFENFCKNLVEFSKLPKITKDNIGEYIEFEGLENLDGVCALGHGCVMVSMHLGNIEVAGCGLARLGYRISAILWQHPNERLAERLLWLRRMGGIEPIILEGSKWFKEAINQIKIGKIVVILFDVSGTAKDITIKFCGQKRTFSKAALLLASHTNAPIVPALNIRLKNNKLKCIIYPPMPPPKPQHFHSYTTKLAKLFESYIEREPWQWLWMPLVESRQTLSFKGVGNTQSITATRDITIP